MLINNLAENSSQVTGLFIMNFLWFMAFLFNEFRRFSLAWNIWNNKESGTTRISFFLYNIFDLVSYMFLLIAFIIHIAFYMTYEADDSHGMKSTVIYPNLDNDHLEQFCPFSLPKLLIVAQAYFSFRILQAFTIWIFESFQHFYSRGYQRLMKRKTHKVVLWNWTYLIRMYSYLQVQYDQWNFWKIDHYCTSVE